MKNLGTKNILMFLKKLILKSVSLRLIILLLRRNKRTLFSRNNLFDFIFRKHLAIIKPFFILGLWFLIVLVKLEIDADSLVSLKFIQTKRRLILHQDILVFLMKIESKSELNEECFMCFIFTSSCFL